MLGGGCRPRDELFGEWIPRVPPLAPDHRALVDRVAENAGAVLPVEGVSGPLRRARCRDAIAVEAERDRARRGAGERLAEDATHDLGLLRDDLELAGDRLVTVGATAQDLTLTRANSHRPTNVTGEGFAILLGHCVLDGGGQVVLLLAIGDGDELRFRVGEPRTVASAVLAIAPQAVGVLGEDAVDAARLGVGDQPLKARTLISRTSDLGVGVDADDVVALLLGVAPAPRDLVIDGAGVLQIGRVAGIDADAQTLAGGDGVDGHVRTAGSAMSVSFVVL